MKNYLSEIMTRIDFPEEAIQFLLREWEMAEKSQVGEALLECLDKYIEEDKNDYREKLNYNEMLSRIRKACEAEGRPTSP
ncbi:MAG: hypothetical protein IKV54_03805, partial [Clostridia bacterium]|nr:hypothetical protein [Clostridia bacterium]